LDEVRLRRDPRARRGRVPKINDERRAMSHQNKNASGAGEPGEIGDVWKVRDDQCVELAEIGAHADEPMAESRRTRRQHGLMLVHPFGIQGSGFAFGVRDSGLGFEPGCSKISRGPTRIWRVPNPEFRILTISTISV